MFTKVFLNLLYGFFIQNEAPRSFNFSKSSYQRIAKKLPKFEFGQRKKGSAPLKV